MYKRKCGLKEMAPLLMGAVHRPPLRLTLSQAAFDAAGSTFVEPFATKRMVLRRYYLPHGGRARPERETNMLYPTCELLQEQKSYGGNVSTDLSISGRLSAVGVILIIPIKVVGVVVDCSLRPYNSCFDGSFGR